MRSIKIKLMIPIVVMFLVFTSFLLFQTSASYGNLNRVKDLQKKSYETVKQSNHLRFSVVQVQQWLTDISATRAAKGYDDGYGEAKKYAKDAQKLFDSLEKLNPSDKAKIDGLRSSFLDYYDKGKQMAAAYISGGPKSGNKMMDKFDKYAEDINNGVADFQIESDKRFDQEVLSIKNTTRNNLLRSVGSISFGFIILILSLLFVIRVVLKPISSVVKEAEKLAEGDFSDPSSSVKKYSGARDEIGKLIKSFETMKKELKTIILDVKNLSSNVAQLSGDITETAEANGKAAEQVASATGTMADGATEQNGQVINIKEQIDESTSRIAEGFKEVNQMMEVATASSKVALYGRDKLKDVVEQYEWIIKTVEFATKSIQDLGKRSEEIGGFINTIQGIAAQTNMLSLNASIEAARAGETGKGFIVVAEEIRSLADNSSDASKMISNLINEALTETSVAVKTMEDNLKKVDVQLSSIQEGRQSLETIVTKVEENEHIAAVIYDIYKDISNRATSITNSITEISNIISDNAAYSEEVAASSEEQCAASEEIKTRTGSLSLVAQKLKKQVSKFKVE